MAVIVDTGDYYQQSVENNRTQLNCDMPTSVIYQHYLSRSCSESAIMAHTNATSPPSVRISLWLPTQTVCSAGCICSAHHSSIHVK
jgi:hypothetical protein